MGKRILILGGDGMLGHALFQNFNSSHEVWVTLRKGVSAYKQYQIFSYDNVLYEIEAHDLETLNKVFNEFKPKIVINCIGIVKQRKEAEEAIESIRTNSLFPHQLSLLCMQYDARLIQISTDCVFSGNKGNYSETDVPDARDLYGRTKLLGEVSSPQAITLRTSIIGLELSRKQSLIEWFLSQHGKIQGHTRAIFTGFTTNELSNIIERILLQHENLSGVWHVSSVPISKYELLCKIVNEMNRQDLQIEPDKSFICDRSLDSSIFREATGYSPPTWDEMIENLVEQIRNREIIQ